MPTIQIMNPECPEETPSADLHMADRAKLLDSARLTIIDNGKAKARDLMLLIADELKLRYPLKSVDVFSKGSASRVINEEEVSAIAENSDLVIAGLGDCGACSACSLADALKMESAGIPSTVLISDVFLGHTASFAVTLGMPGYHSAAVPHPVSSKNQQQLATLASSVVDQVERQLSGK
jgi:hypothetical protein